MFVYDLTPTEAQSSIGGMPFANEINLYLQKDNFLSVDIEVVHKHLSFNRQL